MTEIYAMIAKNDLPAFDKGDIITVNGVSSGFGARIERDSNTSKFKTVQITGVTIDESYELMAPLITNIDNDTIVQHARSITVDVDAIMNLRTVTKDELITYLSRKPYPDQIQNSEVWV